MQRVERKGSTGRGRRARGRCRSVRGPVRARSARTRDGSSRATGSTPRRTPRAAIRDLKTRIASYRIESQQSTRHALNVAYSR